MALPLDDQGVILTCAECGRRNRIRFEHLDRQPRCGQCKRDLPSLSQPIDAGTVRQFDALLRDSSVPVLVDFWAPWCGPCHAVAPELEKVAHALRGRLAAVKVNTDQLAELGNRYLVRSIPTLAVFKAGREVTRVSGAVPASEIVKLIDAAG